MDDALGDDDGVRSQLSAAKRLALVERDTRSHARSLSHIVESMNSGFTEKQMEQLHKVVREEFGDMGFRLDDADRVDEVREDIRFLRQLRMTWNNTSKRVGNSVLTAMLLVAASIFAIGFWAWLKRGQGS